MSDRTEIRGREKFKKAEWIINLLVKILSLLPRKICKDLFNLFRNFNGVSGLAIRYALLKTLAKSVGDNVSIHPGVYLFNVEKISFGNNISIHPMSYIDGAGEIAIGNDVSIAHGTTILSSTHNFKSHSLPIKDQGIHHCKTVIKDNVWIGAKSTILCGSTIGYGSIIGAATVVTKDVATNSIIAGIPGKKINDR